MCRIKYEKYSIIVYNRRPREHATKFNSHDASIILMAALDVRRTVAHVYHQKVCVFVFARVIMVNIII